MSRKQTTIVSCDRCQSKVNEADTEFRETWRTIRRSLKPDGEMPITFDLCPFCDDLFGRWMGLVKS